MSLINWLIWSSSLATASGVAGALGLEPELGEAAKKLAAGGAEASSPWSTLAVAEALGVADAAGWFAVLRAPQPARARHTNSAAAMPATDLTRSRFKRPPLRTID
jgi:hypothetical protein